MKDRNLILIILTGLVLFQCKPGRKVTYDIPANYPEEKRRLVIDKFEKGKELYKTNCAECHGIFTRGRDSVPNFNTAQFDNYSARFMKGDPMNHAIARKMSQEQLSEVVIFLHYKKRKASDTTATTVRPRRRIPGR